MVFHEGIKKWNYSLRECTYLCCKLPKFLCNFNIVFGKWKISHNSSSVGIQYKWIALILNQNDV